MVTVILLLILIPISIWIGYEICLHHSTSIGYFRIIRTDEFEIGECRVEMTIPEGQPLGKSKKIILFKTQ